jgi:toxin HigB-1
MPIDNLPLWVNLFDMIQSFACKHTQSIYEKGKSKKFDARIILRAIVKLDNLAAASIIEDLRVPPGNRLEALSGGRVGQHSIRINDQWRICFKWQNGHAENVEITDYH